MPLTTRQQALRRLIPIKDAGEPFSMYRRAWNICVEADRRKHLRDRRYLHAWFGHAFGAGFKTGPDVKLIFRAVHDYAARRAASQRPLRVKSAARLKTIPIVGASATRLALDAYSASGVSPVVVLHARIRKMPRSYRLHCTMNTLVPDQSARQHALTKRVHRKVDITEIGLAITPEGLDVSVVTQRKTNHCKLYHFAVEDVITPGFAQVLYRRFSAKANTIALDQSMLPDVSGALRAANAELRRLCRSRKAVGAIEFGVVSPVGEGVPEAISYARTLGLSTPLLRKTLKSLRTEETLTCPDCGSPVVLKLDPQSQVPTGEPALCLVCKVMLRAGHLLATRASAHVQYDWLYNGQTPRLGSDRKEAASESKNIKRCKKTALRRSSVEATRFNPEVPGETS